MCSTELTCVLVTLQGKQGLWLVQCENTNVIIISTCGNKSPGVRFTGCNAAHAGHKVGVAGHAVHLCEASVGAANRRGRGGKRMNVEQTDEQLPQRAGGQTKDTQTLSVKFGS